MRRSVLHGLSVGRRAAGREWQIFEWHTRAAISGFADPPRNLASHNRRTEKKRCD